MRRLLIACALLAYSPLAAQFRPPGLTGWYNGDWSSGIPGSMNRVRSDQDFTRVYDDFIVPEGGWTIVGAFSLNSMSPEGVTEAAWEIRSGVSATSLGAVIASGRSPATIIPNRPYAGSTTTYFVSVPGLAVQLPPGRYWLSVAPVTPSQTYLCTTLGANALGEPQGNNGNAYSYSYGAPRFVSLQNTGSGGTSGDYSLGVTIAPPPLPRSDSWRADFTYLVQQMKALHSLPFPGISLDQFTASASDLSSRADTLSDAQLRTGLQALVASIGAPHTDVIWPSPAPFRSLPLSFYWFDDGVYVTAASAPYRSLLGGRVVAVGNSAIDDAIARLTPLIPHDNDSWLKFLFAASRLPNTDFLYATGLADALEAVRIQVVSPSGDLVSATVDAPAVGQGSPKLPVVSANAPLYRQHPELLYWATAIHEGSVVYFQYNSCSEDPARPWANFRAQLDQMLSDPNVERVILDLRNNSGGLTSYMVPWVDQIANSRFNHRGRLYVIVGRATYSAAMEITNRLREDTAAIFVGEPTGAKPRFLLRKGDFLLPYSGIRVSYSNGIEKAADPGPALIPDIPTPVTFADYINGVDRALDAILQRHSRDPESRPVGRGR